MKEFAYVYWVAHSSNAWRSLHAYSWCRLGLAANDEALMEKAGWSGAGSVFACAHHLQLLCKSKQTQAWWALASDTAPQFLHWQVISNSLRAIHSDSMDDAAFLRHLLSRTEPAVEVSTWNS